jgi:glycosyltransferase involved in cell wall biosynthesis
MSEGAAAQRAAAAPRIYWLTTEYFPPETGGTGMIAARLTQGLAERGLEVQVMTRQVTPHCPEQERVGRVHVRRINPAGRMKGAGWRALPAMLAFIGRLARALISDRRLYDLVVVSGMKTIPLTVVPVCRLLGKKCVVRLESPFELVEPISAESLQMMNGFIGRFVSRVLKILQRGVLRRADCVIAISADIATLLLGLKHPPAHVARIGNAVDLTEFKPIPAADRQHLRDRLGFPPGRTIVLYVGRLSRAKGVMMLIEAWPGLVEKYPNAYLVMVGSGHGSWDDCEADIVEHIRKHALAPHVNLVGHSNRVAEYLQAADLFVSPSDYEGFSLTLVEALGCAIPVLTTAVGVAPELIRDGTDGFLCPPRNQQALSAAILHAFARQQEWPRMGERGRVSAQAFDIPEVITQYVALLRKLRG